MKRVQLLSIICGMLLGIQLLPAQTSSTEGLSDFDRVAIAPYVSEQVEYLPMAAKSNLQSKLGQIIASNGFGSSLYNARFILTPNIEVVSKNIVPSAPPRVALKLNVHLMVGDGISGTKYGSAFFTVNGVGENENKAYISALNNIKPNNPEITRLITSAKQRILQFYNTECDFILREAEVAAAQKDWDQALFILTSVPRVNRECYERATDLIASVYQEKVNKDCRTNLLAAQNAWNSGQDYEAAVVAAEYLQNIEPSADCFQEVQRLSNTIGNRIRQIDDREWNFVLKKLDLEENRIDAARDVGVAHGENQPQNMTYNLGGWW